MSRNKVSIRGYKRPRAVDWTREEGREPLFTTEECMNRVTARFEAAYARYDAAYAALFGFRMGVDPVPEGIGQVAFALHYMWRCDVESPEVSGAWRAMARYLESEYRFPRSALRALRLRGVEVSLACEACYHARGEGELAHLREVTAACDQRRSERTARRFFTGEDLPF